MLRVAGRRKLIAADRELVFSHFGRHRPFESIILKATALNEDF